MSREIAFESLGVHVREFVIDLHEKFLYSMLVINNVKAKKSLPYVLSVQFLFYLQSVEYLKGHNFLFLGLVVD